MEFNLDFGTADLTPKRVEGPLLASVSGQAARLSAEEVVFHDPHTGENHVMTLDVLAAMDASRRFQPLEQHVATVIQRLPALKGKGHAVEKVFEFLRGRGLVVEAEEMLTRLKASTPEPQDDPAGLVIRTCDRPTELARLAASLADLERATGRGLRYLVIDDSRAATSENRDALKALTDLGLSIHHLDRSWRQRLCDSLPEPEITREVLGVDDPRALTCGGAWNAALLLTAGERFLMLDDDFVIDPRLPAAGAGRQLSVREGAHVPMHFAGHSLDDLAAALAAPEPGASGVAVDPLAEHLGVCGQPPAVLFSERFGLEVSAETLRGATFDQVEGLLRGQSIKTTAAGAWGDWRMDTNLWFYLAPPMHTQGMRASEASYRALSHQPVMAHGYPHPQLTRMSNFTPLAFDNRQLMPCTAATGRGEDFTFAAWLRYLYPGSLCLHFPTLLRHERPAGGRESPIPETYVPWLSRFAGEYALSRLDQCTAGTPEARLATLVATLRDLAAASTDRQQLLLGQFLAMIRSQIVEQAQTSLTNLKPAPDFWVRDAREWITENGRSLTQVGAPRLRDWPEDATAEDCAELLTTGLTRYADHLAHWPALWHQCRGQRESLVAL
ncbi:MAG: hypothetical protein AAF736_01030 [Pseudomonadota bacterium]